MAPGAGEPVSGVGLELTLGVVRGVVVLLCDGERVGLVVVWVWDDGCVLELLLAGVVAVGAPEGAVTPAGGVVGWQLAVTLWTAGVPGGSMSIGGVPGGALTLKVSMVPLRRVALTVH